MFSSTQMQWQTLLRLLTRSCHKQVVHPQRRLALQTWKTCPRLTTKTLMLLSAFLNDLRQVTSQPKKQLTMMWYLRSTNVWRSTKKMCPEVEQAASAFSTRHGRHFEEIHQGRKNWALRSAPTVSCLFLQLQGITTTPNLPDCTSSR